MNRTPTCSHCHDVIGVYEPMVVVIDGQANTTSRALEQDAQCAGDWYHHDCYEQVRAKAASSARADIRRSSTT
jgi:hypothetical protein